MRPALASALAALLAVPAAARATEPLDLDLGRLGAPDARVWHRIGAPSAPAGEAPTPNDLALASAAKTRFAILSSEMALALSSAILQPASTTGHSGFDFELEAAYVGVHPTAVSGGSAPGFAPPDNWPTRSLTPHELFLPSFHVRKALPFSLEVGGRMIYLSQSSYFGAQVEAKWALNEGFENLPDLAVRAAWTQLFGQRDWNLGAGDLDLLLSKRWGVNAVTSFTPYMAARYTFISASTDVMRFAEPAPVAADDPAPEATRARNAAEVSAAFPTLRAGFFRTTFGLRVTAYAVSLAAEATWLSGGKHDGKANPTASQYPDFELESSWGAAGKFGFEF